MWPVLPVCHFLDVKLACAALAAVPARELGAKHHCADIYDFFSADGFYVGECCSAPVDGSDVIDSLGKPGQSRLHQINTALECVTNSTQHDMVGRAIGVIPERSQV